MSNTYGPYSPTRQVNNLLFISGQVGINPETKIAENSITGQTKQALLNLKELIAKEGLSMNDVVKTTVFITDMGNFTAMNTEYERWFEGPRPTRSAIGVKELPRIAGDVTLLVEIEAVAVLS